MKKHYDKLLLLLGILLIAGGASVFVLKIGSADRIVKNLREGDLSGDKYVPKKVVPVADNYVNWDEPPFQRADKSWKYEVFTPPKIYYKGEFHEKPIYEMPEGEFGLRLLSMDNPPYHIQLKGIIPSTDPSTTRVLLYNDNTKESSGYKKIGNQIWGVTVRSYMKKGLKNTVKVFDSNRGEELTIVEKEKLHLPDNLSMVLQPTFPAGPEVTLSNVGETIESGIYTFTIDEIDTMSNTVTVTKSGGEEDVTEVLSVYVEEVVVKKKDKKSKKTSKKKSRRQSSEDDESALLNIFDNL